MNLFLDTSCLVSFFLVDSHSTKSRPVLEKIVKGEILGLVSALSMVELCGTVRRIGSEEIARETRDAIREMTENGRVKVVPLRNQDASAAAELAISTALKGADAVIVNAAKAAGCALFTFDEEIKARARRVVELYESQTAH